MKALITGITGQDGSYLAELLLSKGYTIYGMVRRASTFNRWRIDHLRKSFLNLDQKLYLEYGDLNDTSSIARIIQKSQPDEIYNLAAQSHVKVSFEEPEYTANSDGVGCLKILEMIRLLGLEKKTKFYQASTSEMFGDAKHSPQNEKTPFAPVSPYGVAKLYAYWITKSYRQAYGIFAVNGILFNHESPRRGANFVTKKIIKSLVMIKVGKMDKLILGNLEARRDWGFAKEYVEVMWLMLQQEQPDDFVIATGETHTVREFVEESCRCLDIPLEWQGRGREEKGIDKSSGKIIVQLNDIYLRPNEINNLRGDITKAREVLGWEPKVKFKELVKLMTDFELKRLKQTPDKLLIDY